MSLLDLNWQAQAVAGTVVWIAVGLAAREVLARADERRTARAADAKPKAHSR